jgi:hypothetical protein
MTTVLVVQLVAMKMVAFADMQIRLKIFYATLEQRWAHELPVALLVSK